MGEYQLDTVLSAVADPTRRAILDRLRGGDARVTELASAFPISLNSTCKHVKLLERAELVHRAVRGRDHVLSLRAEALGEAVGLDAAVPRVLGAAARSTRGVRAAGCGCPPPRPETLPRKGRRHDDRRRHREPAHRGIR